MVLCCDRGCSSELPPASHRARRISRPVCQTSSKSLWQLVMPQRGPCMVTHSDLQMPSATQSLSYASTQINTNTKLHTHRNTPLGSQHTMSSHPSSSILPLTLPIWTTLGAQSVPQGVATFVLMLTVNSELWLRRVGGWHEDAGSLFRNSSLHARTELTWVAYFTKIHYCRNETKPWSANTDLTSVYFTWQKVGL